jgi:hypothetical protein
VGGFGLTGDAAIEAAKRGRKIIERKLNVNK